MKVLITGVCGFVGSTLASELQRRLPSIEVIGLDNLSRPGSELNRARLKARRIPCIHADLRMPSDVEGLAPVDWVIDAAANPSVLAGIAGSGTSSRQLMEHNLGGTLNVLEYCRSHKAGLVLLSSSRVYSSAVLAGLTMDTVNHGFVPRFGADTIEGLSDAGVSERFSTAPPLSLYGAAKLASERLALEYAHAFGFPVFINRCGVLAGAGQFGRPDQGIFSFWIHAWHGKHPLKYIGFGGSGFQVRDCLHPSDLAGLISLQLSAPERTGAVLNVAGGASNALSLAQLSAWCARRFGSRQVGAEPGVRPYDVPWLVLDCRRVAAEWGWRPATTLDMIFEEIAVYAEEHPEWLEVSSL